MNNMTRITPALVLMAVWSVGAIAEDVSQAFRDLDTDGDGYISRSEGTARPDVRANWNTIDTNDDGKLTMEEFAVFEKIPRTPFPME